MGKENLKPLIGTVRPLTSMQQQRRDRLLDVAHQLASHGGYAAVTMRSVAEQADVSLATVYRYFSSKDHLIIEVNARKSLSIIASLQRNPPPGKNAAQRVGFVFHKMLEVTADDLPLASAGVQAMTAEGPPKTHSPDYWQERVMIPYMAAALGADYRADYGEIGEILGHIFFSLMIGLATGRLTLGHAKRVINRSVTLMLHG